MELASVESTRPNRATHPRRATIPTIACLVGAYLENHPERGAFVCKHCHRKQEPREVEFYRNMKDEDMTKEQKARKQKLVNSVVNKRVLTQKLKARNIAEQGPEAYAAYERNKEMAAQNNRTQRLLSDPEARKEQSDKNKAKEAKRRENGGEARGSGTNRFDSNAVYDKQRYDPHVTKLLLLIFQVMIRVCGKEHVPSTDYNKVF